MGDHIDGNGDLAGGFPKKFIIRQFFKGFTLSDRLDDATSRRERVGG
jgi:hypothetical protein